jgi:hypothetical protein
VVTPTRAPTRRALVAVEAMIDSYGPSDAYSFQSWFHRPRAIGNYTIAAAPIVGLQDACHPQIPR